MNYSEEGIKILQYNVMKSRDIVMATLLPQIECQPGRLPTPQSHEEAMEKGAIPKPSGTHLQAPSSATRSVY